MSEGAPLSRPSPPLTGGEGDSPRAWGPSLRTGRRRFVAPKRPGNSSPRREKSPERSEGGGSRRGSPQRSRSSATREGDVPAILAPHVRAGRRAALRRPAPHRGEEVRRARRPLDAKDGGGSRRSAFLLRHRGRGQEEGGRHRRGVVAPVSGGLPRRGRRRGADGRSARDRAPVPDGSRRGRGARG